MATPLDLLDPEHYAQVRRPTPQARPLPNWCYTSPEFYRLEREDFDELAERYYRRMDTILPEDNVAVAEQQRGLRAPINAASRFTHMETLCHAFDNWVLDQVLEPLLVQCSPRRRPQG